MSFQTEGIEFDNITTTQRDNLVNPPKGLVIYNSTTGRHESNEGTPSTPDWKPAGQPSASEIKTLYESNSDTNAFTDAKSTEVSANTAKVSFPEAPNDGKKYGRFNLSWSEIVEGGSDTLASLQVRRTTSYSLTTGFVSITFDITDTETDPLTVKHNDTTTSRVDLLEDGTYLVFYDARATGDNTERTTSSQVLKNGTTLVDGSDLDIVTDTASNGDNSIPLFKQVIIDFLANDYIELQLKDSVSSISTIGEIIFGVIKLDGIRGATGPTGAGSNIIVKKEGVTVGTVSDTINFVGKSIKDITDEGSNDTKVELYGINRPVLIANNSNDLIYTLKRAWIDEGTNNGSGYSSAKLNAYISAGAGTFDVRLVRESDGAVIAEVNGQSNTDPTTIIDMGSIDNNNLPSSYGRCEVHALVSVGSTTVVLSDVLLVK